MSNLRTAEEVKRGCGFRDEGGVYMVAGLEQDQEGVLPVFVLINPPIPYNVKLHRGARLVDDKKVLSRTPLDEWWVGSSKKTEEDKDGDEWSLNTFGMKLSTRLDVGECANAKDAATAIATLHSIAELRVSTNRLLKLFQEITLSKIQELPRIALHYNALHEALLRYIQTENNVHLVEMAASLWRIGHALPPKKRSNYIPHLQRMLISINLPRDAAAMQIILGA